MSSTFLGAEGARELVAWLGGTNPSLRLGLRPDADGRPRSLAFTRPTATATTAPAATPATDRTSTTTTAAPIPDRLLDRHVLSLAPAALTTVRLSPGMFPAGVLVLTNSRIALPGTVRTTADDCSEGALAALLDRLRPRHIRVVVDHSAPELGTASWSAAARELLKLHETAFLVARACAERLESYLVTILDGVDDTGKPRPFTGLFTGFVKSLALELPEVPIAATLHERGAEAFEVSAAELGAKHLLPVVVHAGGRRLTVRAKEQAVTHQRVPALPEDALVVAAGGARGIGAPILLAMAEKYRPRIVILGSTRLDGYPSELLDVSVAEAAAQRADFIRELITGPNRVPVPEANARFDKLQEARTVRATLTELARHCGPDRVAYLRCDLRDEQAVRAAMAGVPGDIDLLLNIAGTNRASDVKTKSLNDFRAVRDLKLRTYLNLKAALAGRLPKRWCNFGSFVGFTGQIGETDYAAANDFLYSAAGGSEWTIGWTLWRDIGLGATPIMRTFLAKSDQFTATPTDEGVAHFLAELGNATPDTMSVYYGDKERAAISAALPDYLEFCRQDKKFPFLDEITRDGDELTATRTFSLDRDGYLDLHQVHGYPTLPGTFVPELAAEAACALVPDRVPVVFENLRLESFLRVYRKGRGETKKIHARLVHADEVESVVEVRILGELVAPNGTVLAHDRLHFSVTVRMRDQPTPSPRWEHWDDHGSRPMIDPYHVPGSAVLLRDVFQSTSDTRMHPLGRRGRLNLDQAAVQRWFPDLIVPSVLLDGLVRVAVLDLVEGRWTPVAIPRTIRRIDLYGRHTDASLAASPEAVELYVTPIDIDLEDERPDNRSIAVSASGDVLLQVKDVVGAIVGYVDQETGQFVDRARFDRGERTEQTEAIQ
ncbi:SDR family NAD(P)-dependent oxidoreductase [Kutzneria sp. CA-103260]|uniref:SDR family NAD(P)-dependent oxidoreductase n=1 Tax=Kutzneria sp. CA-103260 TaxID=2802641 RepID=UPI001BA536E5|nr:SDR family NAD(P)-dependent oxidoreductase [Kutzneria sp. CA-103260]QUQ63902.1 Polyketide synthase dehydratase [Kutzneria sp. CA-103260]